MVAYNAQLDTVTDSIHMNVLVRKKIFQTRYIFWQHKNFSKKKRNNYNHK